MEKHKPTDPCRCYSDGYKAGEDEKLFSTRLSFFAGIVTGAVLLGVGAVLMEAVRNAAFVVGLVLASLAVFVVASALIEKGRWTLDEEPSSTRLRDWKSEGR